MDNLDYRLQVAIKMEKVFPFSFFPLSTMLVAIKHFYFRVHSLVELFSLFKFSLKGMFSHVRHASTVFECLLRLKTKFCAVLCLGNVDVSHIAIRLRMA